MGRGNYEFGKTYVVPPKGGQHRASIVWLHGLSGNGKRSKEIVESLNLNYVKWICPTAPKRQVNVLPDILQPAPAPALLPIETTAWFDLKAVSNDDPTDPEGLDASAEHIANLLAAEQNVELAVVGHSQGAATALYSATCYALGKYGNNKTYPIKLEAVVGFHGWLPGGRSLSGKMFSINAQMRARSLPLLICHGKLDQVVPFRFGMETVQEMRSSGFIKLEFKSYDWVEHAIVPEELDYMCDWLASMLELQRN